MRCDNGGVVRSSGRGAGDRLGGQDDGLGLDAAGVEVDAGGYVTIDHHCRSVPNIYAAALSGKLPLASVASMQGRKVAEHVDALEKTVHRHLDYDEAADAIFTEPEIADVGFTEADAFAVGRGVKVRVTRGSVQQHPKALMTTTGAAS